MVLNWARGGTSEARDVTGPGGAPVIGSEHALYRQGYKFEGVGQKEEMVGKRKRTEEMKAESGAVVDDRVEEVLGPESVAASTSLVVMEELVERFRDKYGGKEREELEMIVSHKVSTIHCISCCSLFIYHVYSTPNWSHLVCGSSGPASGPQVKADLLTASFYSAYGLQAEVGRVQEEEARHLAGWGRYCRRNYGQQGKIHCKECSLTVKRPVKHRF